MATASGGEKEQDKQAHNKEYIADNSRHARGIIVFM
jgi:hypothetical protein